MVDGLVAEDRLVLDQAAVHRSCSHRITCGHGGARDRLPSLIYHLHCSSLPVRRSGVNRGLAHSVEAACRGLSCLHEVIVQARLEASATLR